jgi:FkbM family methyltransferase
MTTTLTAAGAELEELLATSPAALLDSERHGFDRLAGPFSDRLVLFGAGGLGQRTLAGLRKLGVEPLAFADNARSLRGAFVDGLPVFSPAEAAERFAGRAAFVTCVWGQVDPALMDGRRQRELRGQLLGLGCEHVASFVDLYLKHPEVFLPYYAIGLPHGVLTHAESVRLAFGLMADEPSRRAFLAHVAWRLFHDFGALPAPVDGPQYFPDALIRPDPGEVFVDCGAFDGDTLADFLAVRGDSFARYHALEPDPASFARLASAVARLPAGVARRVLPRALAVGASRGMVRCEASGLSSSAVGRGEAEVECVPLDGLLEGEVPTTIKLDVEGAEADALAGARRLIAGHAPVLAVCVYHRPADLWELPLLIHRLRPDYRLFLRPYREEVWELVCYAVPPWRLADGGGVDAR